jgi:hypothetical protein
VKSEHERYEELAVGHVLGGLPASDAADFRAHLLGCRDCRLRVAELRDIAADLAAAEREERSETRLRTAERTSERPDVEPVAGAEPASGMSARHVGFGAIVIVLVAGVLAFWNLHLRAQVAAIDTVVERSERTLVDLASGVPVTTELAGATRGLVVIDGDGVAFSFTDLPQLRDTERLVVWLDGTEDGAVPVLLGQDDRGHLAGSVPDEDADVLLVTVEGPGELDDGPAGRELVRADLGEAAPPSR